MRTGSGLFLSGILTLVQFRVLPELLPILIVTLIAGLITWRCGLLRYFSCYMAGFLWSYFFASTLLQQTFPAALEGRDVRITGHVLSLPEISDFAIQFDFAIDQLADRQGPDRTGPGKVRLNWYKPYPSIMPGQYLDLTVRLKRPHGYMNPRGFDYEAWLFQQQIRATGYVRSHHPNKQDVSTRLTVNSVRQSLRDRQDVLLETADSNALLLALTIGDQSRITRSQWKTLAATGTGHLISISGLHIGLVAMFTFFVGRWIWPLWFRGVMFMPAPLFACLLALLAATIYAALAGFTVPVQRSWIMIIVFTLPIITGKRIASADSFVLALLVVLLLDPLAVLSTSFWLSYGAVLILLLVPGNTLGGTGTSPLSRWLRTQLFIFIGLITTIIIWFNQITPVSMIANAIAIPWVSFITVPLVLSGTGVMLIHETAGKYLLEAGGWTLDLVWPLLEYLASLDQFMVTVARPPVLALVAAITGTALLFMPVGMPLKWLGLFWFLPLFFPQQRLPGHGTFEAVVLDVGQGLAVVVRTRNHLLLYDTGPGFSTGFNAGWAVILPYLQSAGENRIDRLIVSHGDMDHIGGLRDILASIEVTHVSSSVPHRIDFRRVERCEAGQSWEWDGIRFEILSPVGADSLTGNNASCVLKVGNGYNSILLSGDMEKKAEMLMLERGTETINSAVLVAPHHGSATSSSPDFIRAVTPEYAIFSAGFLNRFRLPKQDIMQRYVQAGTKTLNTAETGAISIQFGKGVYTMVTEREQASRFWNFGQ
jgi:competence protein ComEC